MNVYLIVILASLAASWLLGVVSALLTMRRLTPVVPEPFRDVFDTATYDRSQEYTRANLRYSLVSDTVNTALLFAVILSGGFNWLDQLLLGFGWHPIVTGLAYIGALGLISSVIGLPFDIYHTFVLENRFGFNTTTWATFVTDRLKGLVLTSLLGGALLAGILFFFRQTGEAAWLWCWGLSVCFTLALTYVAPSWILPLFNKFTPLRDGDLRRAIKEYARKAVFELSEIFVMDGSKRSTKGNAFFTGLGKRKRIALFDTLIKEQTTDEIVAVLAHEVGHSKRGHITKRLLVGILKTGVIFYLMSLFMHSPALFEAFGMERMSVHAGLIFFVLLYTPLSLLLSVVSNHVSRRHELEADQYAALTTGNADAMISALKKLTASNLSNLTPHPLTVWLEYSHPPVLERIRALSKEAN